MTGLSQTTYLILKRRMYLMLCERKELQVRPVNRRQELAAKPNLELICNRQPRRYLIQEVPPISRLQSEQRHPLAPKCKLKALLPCKIELVDKGQEDPLADTKDLKVVVVISIEPFNMRIVCQLRLKLWEQAMREIVLSCKNYSGSHLSKLIQLQPHNNNNSTPTLRR